MKSRLALLVLIGLSAPMLCWAQSEFDNRRDAIMTPFFGDLDAIRERRVLRVLVSYDSTNYFVVKGESKGLEAELMTRFEDFLNGEQKRESERLHVAFISLPFPQLIPALVAGKGDVVAAGLTLTEAREKEVAFSDPYRRNVSEILVRSDDAPAVQRLEDLAGETVQVLSGSSYKRHLEQINADFAARGLEAISISEADPTLQSEDILQMVNASIYGYAFVDSHIADLWQNALERIVPQPEISIHSGGQIAWVVRKDSPGLLARLNEFVADHKQGTLLGNIFFKRYYQRYYQDTRWIENPLSQESRDHMDELIGYFKTYGQQYGFDWLTLAAMAFQESALDQSVRSGAGAVGVMQIKPGTAADPNVAIKGVEDSAEANIHAATKYLAFLRDRYFSDPEIPQQVQVDFTIAAYNAGPARVRKLRNRTAEVGLDANRWFFNVEHIAQQQMGRETVSYVANINKYYLAFDSVRLQMERRIEHTGRTLPGVGRPRG